MKINLLKYVNSKKECAVFYTKCVIDGDTHANTYQTLANDLDIKCVIFNTLFTPANDTPILISTDKKTWFIKRNFNNC